MEFIRSDDYHADSCLITWNHPNTRMKVTTYPMMHIASADYYRQIARELERCKYVLVEGVNWQRGDKRRHLYDLAAKNLGLAAQEDALQYPPSSKKINLDMPRSEFRTLLFRLPVRYILRVLLLRPILWVITLPPSFRRKAIIYGLLRRGRQQDRSHETPFTDLIVGRRNNRIVENLEKFYRDNGASEQTVYSAIVYGAGHMSAISAGLRRLGFRPGTRRWVEMLRIPPENDGVAQAPTPSTTRVKWS